MKRRSINKLFAVLFILFNSVLYGQIASDQSGILHTTSIGEESNLICVLAENLSTDIQVNKIKDELVKYPEIKSFDIKLTEQYVFIKYNNNISPNQLLAILNRIQITAHYMDAGTAIYYVKGSTDYFR